MTKQLTPAGAATAFEHDSTLVLALARGVRMPAGTVAENDRVRARGNLSADLGKMIRHCLAVHPRDRRGRSAEWADWSQHRSSGCEWVRRRREGTQGQNLE